MPNELTTIQEKPALQRKAIARNADVMSALKPVERALFLSSTDKPIEEYSSVELAKELRDALRWIAKDVGFRMSDNSDVQYLVVRCTEILKRYYQDLSLKDFRMAFEMCLTGELDAYLPRNREGQPDRSHYQNFNAEYICRILNAYRSRRADVFRKVNAAMQQDASGPEMSAETKRRLENKTKQRLLDAYAVYLETGKLETTTIREMLYHQILADAGLAEEIEITDDVRRSVLNAVLAEMAIKGASLGEIRRTRERGIKSSDIEHGAFVAARRNALLKTFAELKENKIDLKDYVRIED